jgi:hypothetical protein
VAFKILVKDPSKHAAAMEAANLKRTGGTQK